MAHGLLPLPAPATLEVIQGWPVIPPPGPGEWTTPTGAALLVCLARPASMPAMVVQRVGLGAGTRCSDRVPNVVRAILGTASPVSPDLPEVRVLEAEMDDLPGEWVPPLFDALFAAGALDVFASSVLMKKGRPGLLVSALASPEAEEGVAHAFLLHGNTLGVRVTQAHRWVLERWFETAQTPWGPVRLKVCRLPDGGTRADPEYEDCAVLAREAGVPVARVHEDAVVAWRGPASPVSG